MIIQSIPLLKSLRSSLSMSKFAIENYSDDDLKMLSVQSGKTITREDANAHLANINELLTAANNEIEEHEKEVQS